MSIDEDYARNALVIRMERSTPAAPPVFKYMPGINGDTVLTADFVGLAWNAPARIIRLISSEKGLRPSSYSGIKEVRVSQFVESPAVLRISFVARDPKLLKSVAIAAGPGMLKVSWPTPVASGEPVVNVASKVARNVTDAEPRTAPQAGTKSAPPVVEAPKIAALTSDEKSSHSKLRLPRTKNTEVGASASGTAAGGTNPLRSDAGRSPVSASDASASTEGTSSAAAGDETPVPDISDDPVPTISLVPCDSLGTATKMEVFRVEVPQGNEISFKAFRLHDPERYVIDIPGCRSIVNSDLPDITSSGLVSSLRVGVPNEGDGVGRLVLQLTDKQVNVADSYTPGSNFFTVTLGKGLMMSSEGHATATTERFSSPELVPGPIIVPRAPSETVIVLDAGHGGTDAGAVRADIQEKDITLAIIQKLKKILESKGARIVLTRHDDTFVSLEDRVKITNQVGPNLFLSVHINSLEGTSNAYGIETYFQTELSRPLAERVHASLVAGLQTPDRNIRRARFYVINHTPVPAILAEVGYITNKTERERLISADWQQKIASSLARGVMLYLQDSGAAGQLANSGSSRGAH
ncbi:MAG: N-acetylmuramoyl-L-alanine amidase [Cyanobacteria bacterium SZAS TMP-1]|nr:N-acetylmuramoyl-L-alanine amidase [Cyanobacteria bacterium SZAS TMP-1]